MDDDVKEEKSYTESPLFFMRCCKKVLFQPKILYLEDKIVVKFICPYCARVVILTSPPGLNKDLLDCKSDADK